jgi:formylglycine-generating enzyme required for sulfatase activity
MSADQTATFYQSLQGSGLLSDTQLRDLQGWLEHQKPDLPAMAREINRRGWLTPYQIKEIAKGRGAGLTVAGRYQMLEILGEGGMGRVYKAHDTRMGRDVAFKVIRKEKLSHPTTAGRFLQEMIALGQLTKHPNVVEVFVADQVGESHYCVMEYIDGSDLTKVVRERGPLPAAEACDIIRQAALGLQHAFDSGLVHRDIKPSNIIVPRNGGPVKLVDLGLARVMDPPGGEDAHRVTQEGFVIGTPDFLAPEQARDPMGVDIRADIYALGGTLYYILTGHVPYEGGTPTGKLLSHCNDPVPTLLAHLPDAQPQLDHLIRWCMAKLPDERPQTPMQLAVALQPFCPTPPPGAGTGRYPVPPPSGRFPPVPAYPVPAYPNSAPQPVPVPVPVPVPAYPGGIPIPLPPLDPNSSSQVFKLPPESTESRLTRRRAAKKPLPVATLLLGAGAVIVAGILAFALYRHFRDPESTPTDQPKSIVADPPPKQTVDTFSNTLGMRMLKLDGGVYRRGSANSEPGHRGNEGPPHEVSVRGFFASSTEVTAGQYSRVMGAPPPGARTGDSSPVTAVTWAEANEFCAKLTEREKGQPWARPGWEYRLPTEAEWEYACRAGTTSPTAFGERLTFGKHAVYRPTPDDPNEAPGAPKAPNSPLDVGKTEANRFGLYDMHGNVAEWCRDWFRPDAYRDAGRDNPTGPADGSGRVVRGGSFREPASAARSAARAGVPPTERHDRIGFRVVYAPAIK